MGLLSGSGEFPEDRGERAKGPIPIFAKPKGRFFEGEPRERITSSVSTVSSWLTSPVRRAPNGLSRQASFRVKRMAAFWVETTYECPSDGAGE
jgi:hypothetical protein